MVAGVTSEVTVVLDARPFALPDAAVEVRFAHPGRNAADDAIVALLAADADPASLVVATSDKGLVARVRDLGASVMPAGELRRALDPHGRFVNAHLAGVFGLPIG